jgi:hypothetical protein
MVHNLCHLLPVKATEAEIIQLVPVYFEHKAENASLLLIKKPFLLNQIKLYKGDERYECII